MEFTGRLTANAKVSTVKGDKEVVNFSVAINDRYKPKDSNETKEFVTYINVGWWMGTGVAKLLTKGTIVTVSGRLYANAYNDMQGEAKASLQCHADRIKVQQSVKQEAVPVAVAPSAEEITEPLADLPF